MIRLIFVLWLNATATPAAEGTVARGDQDRALELAIKPATDTALLARGKERYGIFCAPCHGTTGDGLGRVPTISAPPDLSRTDMPADEIVRIIGHGFGAMPAMAAQLPPRDRWAVAAHVRALAQ